MKSRVPKKSNKSIKKAPVTVLDHLKELQGRLFVVGLFFLLASAVAYSFFDTIVNLLLEPLHSEQELIYLTPGGAFAFIISVCLYAGIIGALPALFYHLYQFFVPAVKGTHLRTALIYTVSASVMAVIGILFVYFIALPAALEFLTGFDLHHISAMLTVDAYMSFIMAYLLAGAFLFQLPLLMLIINSVKPLKPGGLMKHQGKIILGSFIVAAVISPTPDAVNQTLLASPIVVMYQVGIVTVWIANRSRRKKEKALSTTTAKANEQIDLPELPEDIDIEDLVAEAPQLLHHSPSPEPAVRRLAAASAPLAVVSSRRSSSVRSMDGMRFASRPAAVRRDGFTSPFRQTAMSSMRPGTARRAMSMDGVISSSSGQSIQGAGAQ